MTSEPLYLVRDPIDVLKAFEAGCGNAVCFLTEDIAAIQLARLRGLGSFPQARFKQINGLTEKVFTTGRVGLGARRRRFLGAAGPVDRASCGR